MQERVAELRELLTEVSHREKEVSNLGWPGEWDSIFYEIWTSAGGTSESANAWAEAGWRPEDVLTLDFISLEWNGEYKERLTKLDPPKAN